MTNQATGQLNNHFYSFNIGPMHVITLSSEFYFFTEFGTAQISNQYHWLEEDLKQATKPEVRAKHPWILTMQHRPMYCSSNNTDDCTRNESVVRNYDISLESIF